MSSTTTKKDAAPTEPGATLPVTTDETAKAPTSTQVDSAAAKMAKLDQAVIDAQKAVDDAEKTPEQKKLEKAKQDRDDAAAEHAALTGAAAAAAAVPMTVADAKVVAVVAPNTSAGDWRAQKFGNDPANPQLAPGIDPTVNLVKLQRKTPDIPGDHMAYTQVPKEMVGDYCRAGWEVA